MPYEVISSCVPLPSWTGDARAHLATLLDRASSALTKKPRRATKFKQFEICEELFEEITRDWQVVITKAQCE